MSDELAPGAMSLEEPELVGPVTQGQNEPAAQTDDDAPPPGTIEGSGGVKFVPLGAVIEERSKAKAAKAERDTLKTELDAAKTKAEQWDRAKGMVEQAFPLIEKMKNRPDLIALLDQPAPKTAPQPLADPDAIELAKDLDLYKPDGTPDVERAQRIAARQEALADRRAEAKIAPFRQNDHQRASQELKSKLLVYKDAAGTVISPQALEQVWNIVPAELSARPEVAEVLYLMARGIDAQGAKPAQTKPGPVLTTESLGGGAKPESDKPSRFATAAGIPQAEFRKTASTFKPGAVNVLE